MIIPILFWILVIVCSIFWGISSKTDGTFSKTVHPKRLQRYVIYPIGPILGMVGLVLCMTTRDETWSLNFRYGILLPLSILLIVFHTVMSITRMKGKRLGNRSGLVLCTIGQLSVASLMLYVCGTSLCVVLFVSIIVFICMLRALIGTDSYLASSPLQISVG
jgi:hypothetical protein